MWGGRTQARKQNHVTRKLKRIALLNLSDCSLTTYKEHLLDSTLFLRVECKSVSINALRDGTIQSHSKPGFSVDLPFCLAQKMTKIDL